MSSNDKMDLSFINFETMETLILSDKAFKELERLCSDGVDLVGEDNEDDE